MKSLFVVFEGLDGSGTSTQAKRLVDHLRLRNEKVKLTSEPSRGPIGQMIRSALGSRVTFTADPIRFDRQLAFLFAADRHDHLYNEVDGIVAALKGGFHVVCTRYRFSSFAYHCRSEDDFEFVEGLNRSFPEPDLTIYIDVPVTVSLERLGFRDTLDKYENADKLLRAKENYEAVLRNYRGRAVRIPGGDPIDTVHAQVATAVEALLTSVELR